MTKKYPSKIRQVYDLVNYQDNFVCNGTKKDAKRLRLFTHSVHILLINKKGEIMLCKRPPNAKRYPNQITSSAGGHVEKGEDYITAAIRELKEELGIAIPLKDLGRFDVINSKERAIHHLFLGKADKKIIVDPREIYSYYFATPNSIQNDLALHPRKYCKPFHQAFSLYLKSKTPPMAIIDFDHTIFNWYKFRDDFGKYLKFKFGISEIEYKDAKNRAEVKRLYNLKTHMKEISKNSKISYPLLLLASSKFCEKLPNYIFSDALNFLKKMFQIGEIILLTYGDKNNQEFFAEKTGVSNYCKKIISTSTKIEKRYWIKKYTRLRQKIIFVNDDPKETISILKNMLPLWKVILIERPNTKYFPIPKNKIYVIKRKLTNII